MKLLKSMLSFKLLIYRFKHIDKSFTNEVRFKFRPFITLNYYDLIHE